MYGLSAAALGRGDNGIRVEIGLGQSLSGQVDCFVCYFDMQGLGISVRKYGHSSQSCLSGSGQDPDGNLSPIGNKYRIE